MNVLSLVQEKMQQIIRTIHVKNEEVLHGANEELNGVREVKQGRVTGLVTSWLRTVF